MKGFIMINTDIKSEIILRNKGIIVLNGEIEEIKIKQVAEDIIFLNECDKAEFKHLQLILNSTGGNIWEGFMLIDIIKHSKIPIHTLGLGVCASMGILLLCSGTKGYRFVTHNTDLLSHQYNWQTAGKYHELIADRKQVTRLHEKLINHYLVNTKLNRKQIKKHLLPASDVWLIPQEAKEYGLIDKII